MKQKPRFRLTVDKLEVFYGPLQALALSGLNASGNTVSLIGHNGSGKSTLLKTVLQLTSPKVGGITAEQFLGGHWVPLVPEKHMVFSPENGAVFSDVSLKHYIELWCRIRHGRANYYKHEGAAVIEQLNIAPLLPRLGRELSKGQRKRAQIAIGLLAKPTLFILDEPFDGLDVRQAAHLANILEEAAQSMCLLLCSHNLPLIERLSDNIIVLSDGRLVAAGAIPAVCQELSQTVSNISNGAPDLKPGNLNDAMCAFLSFGQLSDPMV